jgi:hypothetical protein
VALASGKIGFLYCLRVAAKMLPAAALLTACAAPQRLPIAQSPPPQQLSPTPAPLPRPSAPGPLVPVPANTPAPPIPPIAMIAPLPIAPPPPPPTDAQSLRARYGAPDFVRQESGSELWRYDGDKCAVFFFLYREGDALKLRYSETLPRGMMMASDPACVESLSGREGAKS